MAVTENLYTGNGSTTNYSFTFPYLATTDIKVSLNSVITTAYTFANATTVQFNTAPANGVAIRIYRDTDDSNLNATFYSGSAIRAQDLNDNFTQNLYVTQEAVNTADSASTAAASAVSTANTALSNSNTAISTANTASSNASAAVSTANTASSNASAAVSTANAASATAAQASIDAASAISTANTASSNASAAVSTANSAAADASQALALVNNVIDYQIVLDVASIPGSPVDGDRIEIVDSTGIESFTPLTGIPGGFTGAAGLSVRMSYSGTGSTWVWYDYSSTDPDSRYILDSAGTVTSTNIADGTIVDADINASAAIAYSKLALTGTIVNADINASAAIALSKLATGALPTAITVASANIVDGAIVNADISDTAEIAVSKLANGTARQLLQTDAAGTGVEWTSNVDIPGTLDVTGATTLDSTLTVPLGSAAAPTVRFTGDSNTGIYSPGADQVAVATNGTERARIDSSGRLLVGTSTAVGSSNAVVIKGTSGVSNASIYLGNAANASTLVAGNTLGFIEYGSADGGVGAQVLAAADGTWSSTSDCPTRLVFFTTADGASSPTERMRIDSAGSLIYGTSTNPGADITSGTGFYYQISTGLFYVRSNASPVAAFNRGGDDGTLVEFKQDQITEGTISVSGTTVSYNGAHLSRWSQITGIDPYNKTVRPEILRGTVMSNLDEMCDWTCPESGECQDNEQLNKTKISDVEGDKNVAGIFQGWDDDDDTWVNDYYLAMTGDFIIRIGAGTTVERGDLLMSTGDGTAKPQDDDIIRSKTIAKVTSTNVTCTYDDGSYCVPCVLMAC